VETKAESNLLLKKLKSHL